MANFGNHIGSYFKGYLLHRGLFLVIWHDFEVIFLPINFIFFMKQHYNCKYEVNMSWFEPAFIQIGQYIQSSSLYTSDRWNISLKSRFKPCQITRKSPPHSGPSSQARGNSQIKCFMWLKININKFGRYCYDKIYLHNHLKFSFVPL